MPVESSNTSIIDGMEGYETLHGAEYKICCSATLVRKFMRPPTGPYGFCVFDLNVANNIADQYKNDCKPDRSSRKARKQEGKKSSTRELRNNGSDCVPSMCRTDRSPKVVDPPDTKSVRHSLSTERSQSSAVAGVRRPS